MNCIHLKKYFQKSIKIYESEVLPRSTRLKPSFIAKDHPLVVAGNNMGLESYGSPTCSDRALMDFPALKIGPGDSARSHMADEYIFIDEIKDGIQKYVQLLQNMASVINTTGSIQTNETLAKKYCIIKRSRNVYGWQRQGTGYVFGAF